MLLKKLNPTAIVVALLTIGFIWAQWPTKTGSKMPEQWFLQTDTNLGYEARFEEEPELEMAETESQRVQLFVASRKGINFMLQVIEPGAVDKNSWLEKSRQLDQKNFGGKLVMDWSFNRQGIKVHEYILSNNNHFVNQVRIFFTEKAVYKLSVGFKEKDDEEQLTRILTFLDSFNLHESALN